MNFRSSKNPEEITAVTKLVTTHMRGQCVRFERINSAILLCGKYEVDLNNASKCK